MSALTRFYFTNVKTFRALGQFGKWEKRLQIINMDTEKVLLCLQLHILYPVRSHLNYTSFKVFGVRMQFGKTGSKHPKSWDGYTESTLSLQLNISHPMRSHSSLNTTWVLTHTTISIFAVSEQFGDTGSKYPMGNTHGQGYTKSNPVFTSKFCI